MNFYKAVIALQLIMACLTGFASAGLFELAKDRIEENAKKEEATSIMIGLSMDELSNYRI